MVRGGSLADILLGLMVCARPTARAGLIGMIAVTAAYLAGTSIWVPLLWIDPLGPTLKSIAAGLVAVVVLAMMDER